MIKTREDLAKLLTRIVESQKIVDAEIPGVMFQDVIVYQRLKAQAMESLSTDREIFREWLENHIGGIVLKGPREKQVAFAKLAEDVGETITFDSSAIYRKLTDTGFGMMGGTGSLFVDQIALCFTEIRLFTRELGMFRVRDPDFQWMFSRSFTDPQELADAMRLSLNVTNGFNITRIALYRHVFETSLAEPIVRTTVPVVLLGILPEEESYLAEAMPHGYTVVDLTDKDVDERLVKETFVALRDTIKNKKETK